MEDSLYLFNREANGKNKQAPRDGKNKNTNRLEDLIKNKDRLSK